MALTLEETEFKRKAILAHATHLAGVEERALVEEREGEEVFWPF